MISPSFIPRDGYDEISLTGAFDIVTNDGAETFYPEDLGFETVSESDLNGGANIEEASEIFLNILHGEGSKAQNDVVIANAAFALQLVNPQIIFDDCKNKAEESLRGGAARQVLEKLTRAE